MVRHEVACGDGKVNLLYEWYIIELRVFYGYILAGILFLVCCQILKIDKEQRKKNEEHFLTGKQGDFIEKYLTAQTQFCLHTFEFISTFIMLIEYFSNPN